MQDILLTNDHEGFIPEYIIFIKREQQYIKKLIKHKYSKTVKDKRFFICRRPDGDFGCKKMFPYKLLMQGTKDFEKEVINGKSEVFLNFVDACNFFNLA